MGTRIQLKDYSGENVYPISTDDVKLSSLSISSSYATDIIATTRNYILEYLTESGTDYFRFSNDCGRTWTMTENTIGDITFVHFFSDGTALVCSTDYCYTTTDFTTFTKSSVYDYDGSEFVSDTDAHSFYFLGWQTNKYHELNGQEVLIWSDYNIQSGYVSRVWMSLDKGATIRCILKNNETTDTDGNTISTRHFHNVWLEDDYNTLWVTSGDTTTQCRLTKGTYSNDSWTWETIGTPGVLYKMGQVIVKRPYAYFVTDYTDGTNTTGLVVCPIATLDDPTTFRYLYKTDDNAPLTKWFEDSNGNKVILGDGATYNKLWFARGNYSFTSIPITYSTSTLAFGNLIGSNALGQVVVQYSSSGGYDNAYNPTLNGRTRFLLSEIMHDAGISDFGTPQNIIGSVYSDD